MQWLVTNPACASTGSGRPDGMMRGGGDFLGGTQGVGSGFVERAAEVAQGPVHSTHDLAAELAQGDSFTRHGFKLRARRGLRSGEGVEDGVAGVTEGAGEGRERTRGGALAGRGRGWQARREAAVDSRLPPGRNAGRVGAMTILLGITGSIAAYKAADLASQLVKQGHAVHAILTRYGAEFITPLTLQTLTRQPVLVSLEDEKQSWKPGHIDLADRADLFVVAPATANVLGNFANGLAPDPLSSIYLALPRATPVLLAPAMNGKMWLHPATQRNVARLAADGCHFVGPAEGDLACGYEGLGRLAPVEEILAHIGRILAGK